MKPSAKSDSEKKRKSLISKVGAQLPAALHKTVCFLVDPFWTGSAHGMRIRWRSAPLFLGQMRKVKSQSNEKSSCTEAEEFQVGNQKKKTPSQSTPSPL